ncbi:5875_t:CDS:1, partial [Funneliformis caledonium]
WKHVPEQRTSLEELKSDLNTLYYSFIIQKSPLGKSSFKSLESIKNPQWNV